MKCLIIAAGHGSRLRALSPCKPLTRVNGIPLVERVIRSAIAGGAADFTLVTGHEAERVEAFVRDLGERLAVPIRTVRTGDWNRPNGHSVLSGAALIDGDYLLLMADHLFDPSILARLLRARGQADVLLAADRRIDSRWVDLDDVTRLLIGDDGRILDIGKGIDPYNGFDTGLFLAGPALAAAIEAGIARGGQGSLSEGVKLLAAEGKARAVDSGDSWWIDIDDPAALDLAERHLAECEDNTPVLDGRGA